MNVRFRRISKSILFLSHALSTNTMKLHKNEFLMKGVSKETFSSSYAIIFLNSESTTADYIHRLWNQAAFRICADGGANRLHDSLSQKDRKDYLPEYIAGDLDSIRPDVYNFYKSLGTKVLRIDDQDNNDLDKCLNIINDHFHTDKAVEVLVIGAFGGRFDQELACIHALYKWQNQFSRMVMLGGVSALTLLTPGQHTIRPVLGVEGPTCGLVPMSGVCRDITTVGLKWNLEHGSLEMGKLISTSNEIICDTVLVDTDNYLLWTVTLSAL